MCHQDRGAWQQVAQTLARSKQGSVVRDGQPGSQGGFLFVRRDEKRTAILAVVPSLGIYKDRRLGISLKKLLHKCARHDPLAVVGQDDELRRRKLLCQRSQAGRLAIRAHGTGSLAVDAQELLLPSKRTLLDGRHCTGLMM